MIAALLAATLAAHATAQDRIANDDSIYEVTGDYRGPGSYCDAGFRLRLEAGDRIQFLNPLLEYHRLRIELGGRRVEALVGRRRARGQPLNRNGLRVIRRHGAISYSFPAGRAFAEFESPGFAGPHRDGWFLRRIDLGDEAGRGVACLTGNRDG